MFSERLQRGANPVGENFRLLLNTNTSVNSEITAETDWAISSEISSRMSRTLEEVNMDLDTHILETINLAIG